MHKHTCAREKKGAHEKRAVFDMSSGTQPVTQAADRRRLQQPTVCVTVCGVPLRGTLDIKPVAASLTWEHPKNRRNNYAQ